MTSGQDTARDRPTVARADAAALAFTAPLHRTALPGGFFAGLGVGFLRAYHESFLASPHAVALVARWQGRPVGFLVGTVANAEHYRWVARNRGPALALRGVAALAVRPAAAVHFLRTRTGRYARALLRMAGRGATAPQPAEPGAQAHRPAPSAVAVLTHVAVTDEARGHGVGAALVEAFTAAAEDAGAGEAQLVTAADDPGTHAFYRRCGWAQREDRPDHDGRMVTRFVRRMG